MRATTCDREERIRLAVRGGELAAGDRGHLEACPKCSAAVAADAALRAAAAEWSTAAGMAGASQLLLRARLEARRTAAERSLRPILVWQGVAGVTALIALAVGLALWSPTYQAFAARPSAGAVAPAHWVLAAGVAALTALLFARRSQLS